MNRSTVPDCPFCERVARPGDDFVVELETSVILLGPWQFYDGYCLVVSKTHARELRDLGNGCAGFLEDMARTATAILEVFRPLKLNYELLGNRVEHPHWHLFPRYADDPGRLSAVWLDLANADDDPDEKRRLQTGPRTRRESADRLREWFARDKR